MKKITLIVQSKDIDITLDAVRKLGVLHIEHENPPRSEDIERYKDELKLLLDAVNFLPDNSYQEMLDTGLDDLKKEIIEGSGSFQTPHPEERSDEGSLKILQPFGLQDEPLGKNKKKNSLMAQIINLIEEKELLLENLKKIEKGISIWQEWGDFDPGIIEVLEEKLIRVRLCRITALQIENIPEGVILAKFFKKGNIFYCAVVSRKEIILPFETLEPPEMGLEEMKMARVVYDKKIKEIDNRIEYLSRYKKSLLSYSARLQSIIELNEVRVGMGRFKELSYLKGYLPLEKVGYIQKAASKEKWGIIVEDPLDNDSPPTFIKNPKWIEIIKPVFKIINTIPGYKELDISLHFLIFFSLFFGMLIGDAGYGIIYILTAMFLRWKLKNFKDKKVFFLIYLLSSVSIAWGLITGVFFGPHLWLKPFLPYFADSINAQSFCFLIGATQLSVAHLWKFLRKWPSLKALSDIGWILILWLAYFLANTLILSKSFPMSAKWFFIIGAGLVILFTSPRRNILKGVGLGLGDFLLKSMNSFGDVVSYIRLFAVGTAGVAIADAFNQIASNIGSSSILNIFASLAVLFLGHTLNIIMGVLAILVHGVRLNVLEFSGHLDMEWSGVEYAPFRDTT